MAGSTESKKRMGELVSKVGRNTCPPGYTGTPPNCKKIKLGDIDFSDDIWKKTNIKTSEKPTTLPFDPTRGKEDPIKGKLYKPGDNKLELH